MRTALRWLLARPLIVPMGAAVAVLAGVLALLHLPVDLFPGMDVPVVNVISHRPGASPEDMERLVTRPLEARLRGITGLRRVASTSTEGLSRITVQFEASTPLRDARQRVQTEVAAARSDLPAGVVPRIENIGTTLDQVAGYVVFGGSDLVELRNAVRLDVAGRLTGLAGVSRVDVEGGDERAFVVTMRPAGLARLHLTLAAVADALRRQNVSRVPGYLERGGREYVIRGDGRIRTIDDVRAVAVPAPGGPVRLGDVATIREGRTPRHYVVHGDGVPAVAFTVRKAPGASTIAVVDELDRTMPELRRLLPEGARIEKFYDQSSILRSARDDLVDDLLVGALLAVGVLWLFLGAFRATLLVAATIPLALLLTLGIMPLVAPSLNVVTISALTLAVGMVVDDAIVVTENAFRHRRTGASPADAAVDGTAEIAAADAAGTFTTIVAFLPLVLVTGIAGTFLAPFGLVIGTALLVSLLLSLTLVPVGFAVLRVPAPGRSPGRFLLSLLDRALARILGWVLAHRLLTAVAAVLLAGAVALLPLPGPVGLVPPIDEGAVLVEYVLPPGTSLAESDRFACELERRARAEPDVRTVYRRTGSPEEGYQVEGVNKGEMTIRLAPRGERTRSADDVLASLRASFETLPGAVFLYHQPTQEKMDESFTGLPALFGVTVYGDDPDRLVALAAKVEDVLARDPAVGNVVNNTKVRAPQISVRLRPGDLARLGVEPADALDAIRAARLGLPVTSVVRPRETVDVILRLDAPLDSTIGSLRDLPVPGAASGPVPLSRVADVTVDHVPAEISRLDGRREVTVVAEVEGNIPAVVDRLRPALDRIDLGPRESIAFSGQYEFLLRAIVDLGLAVAGAALLVYLLLVMRFSSWLEPLTILVTIPAALAGAWAALSLSGLPVDLSAGMGALTLAGIAVNNAIVLLDRSNREGLLVAARERLRPILLTALTTILALLPIATSPAVGSQAFRPFAVTVIGGLLTATAATLLLVPALAAGAVARREARGDRAPGSAGPLRSR